MRIGIFGSAFDPITLGHLRVAKLAAQFKKLDKVIFVPSSDVRADKGRRLTSNEHRWEMLKLALVSEPSFEADDLEMAAPMDYKYTYYTMEHFKDKYEGDEVYFILGSDILKDIPKWVKGKELVENNRFIVVERDDHEMKEAILSDPLLYNNRTNFNLVNQDLRLSISSTYVREEIEAGRDPKYLLPLRVNNYIMKHDLYREHKVEEQRLDNTLQIQIEKHLRTKPEIIPSFEIRKRVDAMKEYLKRNPGLESLVLGISGGQDSTLTGKLAQMAVNELNQEFETNKYKFIAVRLPYDIQADERDCQDAIKFINPDKLFTINIKPAVDTSVSTLEDALGEDLTELIKGNEMARERMKVQYSIAGMYNGLVLGTDHASEAVMGFFTKYGDGACDFVPLYGLTKDQGTELLQELGCPSHLYLKDPTDGLNKDGKQVPDEVKLGVRYPVINSYLKGERIDEESRKKIEEAYLKTQHKRELPVTIFDL